MEIETTVQIRAYGAPCLPTLIYLPGLHGDWTLIAGFRTALAGRVRFVEMTYPRTLTWSLDDYAREIEAELARHEIREGWLLGESFGSQVLWSLVKRGSFHASGLILAGGFTRHPARWLVWIARRIGGNIPLRLITKALFGYAKIARARFRHSPEVVDAIDEFVKRRTEMDRRAAVHRLKLIFENNPRPVAATTRLPLYAITGALDPIVPWPPVRRWLRKNCGALLDYKVVKAADHNVLGTAPKTAADQIAAWVLGGPA